MACRGRHLLQLGSEALQPTIAEVKARLLHREAPHRCRHAESRDLLLEPGQDAAAEGGVAGHEIDDGSTRRLLEQEGRGNDGRMSLPRDAV